MLHRHLNSNVLRTKSPPVSFKSHTRDGGGACDRLVTAGGGVDNEIHADGQVKGSADSGRAAIELNGQVGRRRDLWMVQQPGIAGCT